MENNARPGQARIPGLLWSLAVPAVCAQLVSLLYNLIDRIYIGQLPEGTLAMAALGICAPIVSVISGFTGLFGRGGSPLASICLGRQDRQQAEQYLGNSFGLLVISSLVITAGVLAFEDPLLQTFGASPLTLPYARAYLSLYILGTLFVQVTVGMNYYITAQGFARTAMMTTMLGAGINLLLDPLFIFVFGMGVRGAALATVLSQLVSFGWVMAFLGGKKPLLQLQLTSLRLSWPIVRAMLGLGATPFFMSVSEGVLNICFNRQVSAYGGDAALSVMTILFSLFQFILLPVEGVAQGSQPIIGYNYGAGQIGRVRETIRLALLFCSAFTILVTSALLLYPAWCIRLFSPDANLLALGCPMLRIYIAGVFTVGANSTFQQTYNSLGQGGKAFFFAFLRKILLLIPLLYLLPVLFPWGVYAVVLAEPVSDILTALANALYFHRFLARLESPFEAADPAVMPEPACS